LAFTAPDYFAGSNDPIKGAAHLFAHAGWIRRLCNEITAEPTLNVHKIYQLAEQCFLFRLEADKWRSGENLTLVLAELVRLVRAAGVGNAVKTDAQINTDSQQLYTAAGNFVTFSTNNLPAAAATIASPTVTVNRTWPSPDLTVTVTKVAAVTNQVNTLRAVFD
jgi:hypothetical protein